MNLQSLSEAVTLLRPHVVAMALIAMRLTPVAFLCPLLGGSVAPQTVRLGLVLSMAGGIHFAGGVSAVVPESPWVFGALAVRELVFGLVLGLVAGLPFDAARMGGRFIDLFRGTSAEASLPHTGTKESASADGLYQLVTALAMSGVGLPLVLSSFWRTYAVVPLGTYAVAESAAMTVVHLAMSALAAGLAIGAPIAAVALGVDCLLGLAARAAPQMNLQETSAPLKILGGGTVLWLGVGLLSDKALQLVAGSADSIANLARGLQ